MIHHYSISFLTLIFVHGMVAMEAPNKMWVTWAGVDHMCEILHEKIKKDNFKPDLLVGIARGGLFPLALLSGERMLNNRHAVSVNISSYEGCEQGELKEILPIHTEDWQQYKNILLVDDIVDTGASFKHMLALLKKGVPEATVKTVALFYKAKKSCVKPDYYAQETNEWIVFPWENDQL